jgi:hypothetical protein
MEPIKLLREISREFERLRPQSIRPAEGFIKHDYLIPAGFYDQMWDWDRFCGRNMMFENMVEGVVRNKWMLLNLND